MVSHHEPVVIERTDWRITEAECSCGAKLELGKDSGSTKEQMKKVEAAFEAHKKDRANLKPKKKHRAKT